MAKTASVQRTITLDRGKLLRVYDGEGLLLTPGSGVLWITEERSANDTFLLPGETYRLAKPGLALVHAHRAARVVIELPAGNAKPRRVDVAPADGASGRRVAFPTRGYASLARWVRAIFIAIRNWFAAAAAGRARRMWLAHDGSPRVFPFPYY